MAVRDVAVYSLAVLGLGYGVWQLVESRTHVEAGDSPQFTCCDYTWECGEEGRCRSSSLCVGWRGACVIAC